MRPIVIIEYTVYFLGYELVIVAICFSPGQLRTAHADRQGSTVKSPPLAAIRAFEAVGRTGSVNLAATELGVTSGAITQHVHTLEKYVGHRLVERSGRGIVLTAWGYLYLPRLTVGFTEIRKALDDLERGNDSHHLVISTYPSLAPKWLGPLMSHWQNQHPEPTAMITGVHPAPN